MKSFKQILAEVAQPKSEDELEFKAKHGIEVMDHPESEESQHTSDKPRARRRADYEEGEDMAVYEAVTDKDTVLVHQLIKGADGGKYATLNIAKVTPTHLVAYDHNRREMIKFDRKTNRGLGNNSDFMIKKIITDDVDLDEASQSRWEVDIKGAGRASVKAANRKQAITRALSQLGISKNNVSMYVSGVLSKDVTAKEFSEDIDLDEAADQMNESNLDMRKLPGYKKTTNNSVGNTIYHFDDGSEVYSSYGQSSAGRKMQYYKTKKSGEREIHSETSLKKSFTESSVDLDEAVEVKPAVIFSGRKFTDYKTFTSDKETNTFLAKNPNYGVIGEKGRWIYVAKMKDKGVKETLDTDESAFVAAAAYAKKDGKKKFKFADKEFPVTIKKDIADKITESPFVAAAAYAKKDDKKKFKFADKEFPVTIKKSTADAITESNTMAAIGRKLQILAAKEKNDMIANAMSNLGDHLESYGLPFGARNMKELEKKTGLPAAVIQTLIKKAGGSVSESSISVSVAQTKALHNLMLKALGKSRLPNGHQYRSVIADNGDFIVQDGGGRNIGRIAKGEFVDPLKESAHAGWIAFFNNKKLEIPKDKAKDLYGAKMYAAKELNVPKSKMGLLAIQAAYDESAELDEDIRKMSDSQLKTWLQKNDTDEPNISPVFGQQLIHARKEMKRRGLKLETLDESDNTLSEIQKLLTKHSDKKMKVVKDKSGYFHVKREEGRNQSHVGPFHSLGEVLSWMKKELKESVGHLLERPDSSAEAIKIIATTVGMTVPVVKDALEVAKLDPLSLVTALRGTKTIKNRDLADLLMGYVFGDSFNQRDLANIKKKVDAVWSKNEELKESAPLSQDQIQIDALLAKHSDKKMKVFKGDKSGYYHVEYNQGRNQFEAGPFRSSGELLKWMKKELKESLDEAIKVGDTVKYGSSIGRKIILKTAKVEKIANGKIYLSSSAILNPSDEVGSKDEIESHHDFVKESLDEAKMDNDEVLAAAKTLAKNGKDDKAKDFGQGLVDFYDKNGSFTPAQVGGLQNIMKNASFQFAKESLLDEENFAATMKKAIEAHDRDDHKRAKYHLDNAKTARYAMKSTEIAKHSALLDKYKELAKLHEDTDLVENFKTGSIKLDDGSSVIIKKQDADLMNQMFADLNSTNKTKMMKVAMKDKSGFEEILGFAREAL